MPEYFPMRFIFKTIAIHALLSKLEIQFHNRKELEIVCFICIFVCLALRNEEVMITVLDWILTDLLHPLFSWYYHEPDI
jgi:hypothetical protein